MSLQFIPSLERSTPDRWSAKNGAFRATAIVRHPPNGVRRTSNQSSRQFEESLREKLVSRFFPSEIGPAHFSFLASLTIHSAKGLPQNNWQNKSLQAEYFRIPPSVECPWSTWPQSSAGIAPQLDAYLRYLRISTPIIRLLCIPNMILSMY